MKLVGSSRSAYTISVASLDALQSKLDQLIQDATEDGLVDGDGKIGVKFRHTTSKYYDYPLRVIFLNNNTDPSLGDNERVLFAMKFRERKIDPSWKLDKLVVVGKTSSICSSGPDDCEKLEKL